MVAGHCSDVVQAGEAGLQSAPAVQPGLRGGPGAQRGGGEQPQPQPGQAGQEAPPPPPPPPQTPAGGGRGAGRAGRRSLSPPPLLSPANTTHCYIVIPDKLTRLPCYVK